jgi:hypothetical protein
MLHYNCEVLLRTSGHINIALLVQLWVYAVVGNAVGVVMARRSGGGHRPALCRSLPCGEDPAWPQTRRMRRSRQPLQAAQAIGLV